MNVANVELKPKHVDEYGDAVIEFNRQRHLLATNNVKSTGDWHLYQRAVRVKDRLERERDLCGNILSPSRSSRTASSPSSGSVSS